MLARVKNLGILSLLFLMLFGCGSSKGLPNGFSFRLEKGGCMDVCKSYIIEIRDTGYFTYRGYQNVTTTGNHSGKLSSSQQDELANLISKPDWKTLEENYQYRSTDQQQNIIKFNDHTVVYYRVIPEEIKNLEHFINELVDTYEF